MVRGERGIWDGCERLHNTALGLRLSAVLGPMSQAAHGKDRKEAIDRMVRAIDEYKITGIETTLPFGKFVMQHEAFVSGKFDTHFVEKYFTPEVLEESDDQEALVAAMVGLQAVVKPSAKAIKNNATEKKESKWKTNRVQLR